MNRISDNSALLVAAAKMLVGTMPVMNSAMGGDGATGSAWPSAARSACPAPRGIGASVRSSGVTIAAMLAVNASSDRKVAMARPAVISSVTTSGMTVICTPLSHNVPIGRATAIVISALPGARLATATPAIRPAARLRRISVARDMAIPSWLRPYCFGTFRFFELCATPR